MKVGDFITRNLAGIRMRIRIASITDDRIDCGWEFDRKTGAEIDDFLDWGPPPKMTGSYIDLESASDNPELAREEV